nr:hypothetical protein [Tanacetum cinerariifolium]
MKSTQSKEGGDVKVRRRGGKIEESVTEDAPLKCSWRKTLLEERNIKRNERTIGMVRGIGHKKRPYEKIIQWMDNEILFPSVPGYRLLDSPIVLEAYIEGFQAKLRESRIPLVGFLGEVNYPLRVIDLSVTMGEQDKIRTVVIEFVGVKCHSHYNVILERTWRRSLGVVVSTINLMIKFPTANGIATMVTNREALRECRRIEEAHGFTQEGRMTHPQIRADTSLRNRASTKNLPPHRARGTEKEKLSPEKEESGQRRNAYKGFHHIHMSKKYEEKTTFHTDEGILCYTKIPSGLKNMGATYQRLVDTLFEWQIEAAEEAFQTMKRLVAELPTLTTPIKDKKLTVYLSTAAEAVNVVLLIERNEKQMSIYYVSRSLQGDEINYALIEKLELALVHATRKLIRAKDSDRNESKKCACVHRFKVGGKLDQPHTKKTEQEGRCIKQASRSPVRPCNQGSSHGGPLQTNYVIREIYIDSCGMHDGPRMMVHKEMSTGYYWPSMHMDANNEIKGCDACQAYAMVPRTVKG